MGGCGVREPLAGEETLCLNLSMEQPEGLAREPGEGGGQRGGTRGDVSRGKLSLNHSGHGAEGRVVGNGNIPLLKKSTGNIFFLEDF